MPAVVPAVLVPVPKRATLPASRASLVDPGGDGGGAGQRHAAPEPALSPEPGPACAGIRYSSDLARPASLGRPPDLARPASRPSATAVSLSWRRCLARTSRGHRRCTPHPPVPPRSSLSPRVRSRIARLPRKVLIPVAATGLVGLVGIGSLANAKEAPAPAAPARVQAPVTAAPTTAGYAPRCRRRRHRRRPRPWRRHRRRLCPRRPRRSWLAAAAAADRPGVHGERRHRRRHGRSVRRRAGAAHRHRHAGAGPARLRRGRGRDERDGARAPGGPEPRRPAGSRSLRSPAALRRRRRPGCRPGDDRPGLGGRPLRQSRWLRAPPQGGGLRRCRPGRARRPSRPPRHPRSRQLAGPPTSGSPRAEQPRPPASAPTSPVRTPSTTGTGTPTTTGLSASEPERSPVVPGTIVTLRRSAS